jgi:hypothetical protein
MSWIKFETATSHKPEVWQMAQDLGIDPDAVVGKLLRVWAWFDEQTENGNAPSVTKALLDRYVGVTGFVTAMLQVGWLSEDETGISIPNFDRHNGSTAKKRASTAKRVAESRVKEGDVTQEYENCNASNVTSALPREEKIREREDKNNNTPHSPPRGKREKPATYQFTLADIPPELGTNDFRRAWANWILHRREIKKPITATSAKSQLKWCAAQGERQAVAAIEYTIRKGWQGLERCPKEEKPRQSFEEMVAEFRREPQSADI